ncbi:MAG: hypothetical protein VX228_16915, partial [Pseudomonadota bacterium]|nr:hypothetical protein [Pseudomonadota bacterium]
MSRIQSRTEMAVDLDSLPAVGDRDRMKRANEPPKLDRKFSSATVMAAAGWRERTDVGDGNPT